ncbi:MAG: 50S ribosomal protein L29 [Actinobacteria bacterium]|nr:50S ribosomal protein L29 [Actinomycetota bacterium]
MARGAVAVAGAQELRDLSVEELERRLIETKEELFNLRFQNATGQLDNYRRLRELRKDIARVKTVLREKELEGSRT